MSFELYIDPKPGGAKSAVTTVPTVPGLVAGSSPRSICPLDKAFPGLLGSESRVGDWHGEMYPRLGMFPYQAAPVTLEESVTLELLRLLDTWLSSSRSSPRKLDASAWWFNPS